MKKKIVSLALVFAMALALGIGGTIAWLTDTTDEVKNTFTVGNIDIELNETTGEKYKMVPGSEIEKDPKVTVKAGSEDCWVFVKIVESANLDTFIDYSIADGWTVLPGVEGVYYREAKAGDAFDVIGYKDADEQIVANKVLVKDTVTKTDMDNLTEATYPTLTFTAYAVQKENMADVNAAWTAATSSAT